MKTFLTSVVLGVFLLSGCNDPDTQVHTQVPYQAGAYIVFDSANGDIPYPNNILFAGSQDTTLNIPYDPSSSDAPVKRALNALDGFSTSSPITVSFTGEIDPSTLPQGLRVYEVQATPLAATAGIPLVQGITKKLQFGIDYVATISNNKIVILPIKPLKSHQNYMIALTKAITDTQGNPIAPDIASELLLQNTPLVDAQGNHTTLDITSATQLEGLRQLTQAMLGYAQAQDGLNPEDVATIWTFQTQTIGTVAQKLNDVTVSAQMQLQDTNLTSKMVLTLAGYDTSAMQGNAEIYAGVLGGVPYYLAKATSTHDTAPLTRSFVQSSPTALPELNATVTIPVLVSIPKNMSMPSAGWPVVIFQHGITQDRTNLLSIAEAFASIGYAAVAIDLPLHGITNTQNPFYMASLERTFDLDLVDNTTGAPTPDGVIDPSGKHYINLASLLTSRDNVRQTTADLSALKSSFGAIVASDGTKFDPTHVAFVGHSLGTIAPFGFFATNDLESVTLAMPGGGIAELLNNSATFGPIIEAGLAQNGIMKGSDAYSAFMLATQTVLDDADPINYAIAVGQKHKIFAIEVVGGNGNLPDQVIPNNVATAPLAGTDPLVAYLQATTLQGATGEYIQPNKVARYNVGDHSSILDPSASLEATISMQQQTAGFVYSQGTAIAIPDATLLNMQY